MKQKQNKAAAQYADCELLAAADKEGESKMDEWTTYFISVESPYEGECDDIVEDLGEKYPLHFTLSPHAILIRTSDKVDADKVGKVLSNCYPLIQGDKVLIAAIDPDTMCGAYETGEIRRMLGLPEKPCAGSGDGREGMRD